MNRQELEAISSRLAANAEVVMVNNENFQANAQSTVMVKDQQLVQMQSQITEFAGSMMNALVNG